MIEILGTTAFNDSKMQDKSLLKKKKLIRFFNHSGPTVLAAVKTDERTGWRQKHHVGGLPPTRREVCTRVPTRVETRG